MPACVNCGAEIKQSDAFCPSCGTRQVAAPVAAQQSSASLPTEQSSYLQRSSESPMMTQTPSPQHEMLYASAPPASYPLAPPAVQAPTLTNYNAITNTVNVAPPVIVMNMKHSGPPLIVRAFWWLFVGWWLSAIVAIVGWFFIATLILMPIGIWFIHRIPQAQTLRPRTRGFHTEFQNGAVVFTESTIPQHPWYVRVLYTVCIGLWIGLPWILLGWALGWTLILLPLSIWMLDRAPAVTTLQRH